MVPDWILPQLLVFIAFIGFRVLGLSRRRREAQHWNEKHPTPPEADKICKSESSMPQPEVEPIWENEHAPLDSRAAAIWQNLLRNGGHIMIRQSWDDERLTPLLRERADREGLRFAFNGALHAEHDYFEWQLVDHPKLRGSRYRLRGTTS
jgi:hypothetical protein